VQARAGGASNYDECMLEQMKNQGYYMGEIAKDFCTRKFPPQPAAETSNHEIALNRNFIKYYWTKWEETEKQIYIDSKPDNYVITKVTIDFAAKNQCAKVSYPDTTYQFNPYYGLEIYNPPKEALDKYYQDQKTWLTVAGDKAFFSPTYTFKTPPGNFNCTDVYFYGFIK
jgi:hypothetical protein